MASGTRDRLARPSLVILGIVVLAFNLRPAAVSVGPVLDDISRSLRMGAVATGILTSMPVLCFATVGALAPRFARHLGLHRTTLAALVLVVGGLLARVEVSSAAAFLILSFVSLAGMAVANVLLPSLVKLHFPDRIGLLTAVYSTGLAIGLTSASVLTVPIAQGATAAGAQLDWRHGLVVWAFTAAIAVLPWIAMAGQDRRSEHQRAGFGAAMAGRTRIGWLMAGFFGLQSLQAYAIFGWLAKVFRDSGFSADSAGLLLGVTTGIGIPLSFLIPRLTARTSDPRWLLTAIMASYPVGYLGLILAPRSGAWLWAAALGIGTCTFPFILTLIGLRSRTPAGTAALSGFTQSVGYLIAVIGPFGTGALHAASHGWSLPLGVLLALCVPQYLVGLAAARPAYVEDQLQPAHADSAAGAAGSRTSKHEPPPAAG